MSARRARRRSAAASPPFLIGHDRAARLLGISRLTIRLPGFRAKHAIPFVRIGNRVLYEPKVLRAYIRKQRVNSIQAVTRV
jgi:hypothetical protein